MRANRKLWADLESIGARNFAELRESGLRFRHGVKRQRRLVSAVAFLGRIPRILFLQMRRVGKEQRTELTRSRIRINGPAEAVSDQPRNVAGVIDMRVRQQQPVDGGR